MATGNAAIAHSTIDALDQRTRVRYFRRTLINAGVLPEIDVFLHDLEVYAKRLFADLPPEQATILGRYFRWTLLPVLRRTTLQQPMSSGKFGTRRRQLRLIVEFLEWLTHHDMSLGTADQSAVDHFIAQSTDRAAIGPFITWARKEKLTTRLTVTTVKTRGNASFLSDDSLHSLILQVFESASLPLPARIVCLLALVFAQSTEASVALTREQITDADGELTITFSSTPLVMPEEIATLVRQQLANLERDVPHHPMRVNWLFPGTMPNQHLTAASIERVAAQSGIPLRAVKFARLQHFAQSVPASIIADTIGISVYTAVRRSADAGGVWHGYQAAKVRIAQAGNVARG